MSCPPQVDRSSEKPPVNEKNDHNNEDLYMSDEIDGGASLIEEQKKATQAAIMMQDLGSGVRDRITSSDVTRAPNVSLKQLRRGRAVEDPGSQANKAYMENKKKINGWNNLYVELKNDGSAEDLDPMMDGQSHRAKLRDVIVNGGGQHYHPHNSDDPPHDSFGAQSVRGGSRIRQGRGGGVVGTSGRKAPISPGRIINTGNVISRPLDPAIDTNDPRSKYNSGRETGHKSRGTPQLNRPPARSTSSTGRGLNHEGTRQDVRDTIAGTTLQATAAFARPSQSRQLSPNFKGAAVSSSVNRKLATAAAVKIGPAANFSLVSENADIGLDPVRFLAAVAASKDRETFNKMVPSQPKPAPASRAATIVGRPSKKGGRTFNKLVPSTPKPSVPSTPANVISVVDLLQQDAQYTAPESNTGNPAREEPEVEKSAFTKPSVDIQRAENQKTERPKVTVPNLANSNPNGYEEQLRKEHKFIRQVPTHEFVFPRPNSRSTKLSADVDAYTDGILTPGTPSFSASTEDSVAVVAANEVQEGCGEATKCNSVPLEAMKTFDDLGISLQPTSLLGGNANVEGDLLMLGSDEAVGCGSGASLAQNTQVSGAVVDLIDLDFSNTAQESGRPSGLEPVQEQTPKSEEEPIRSSAKPMQHPSSVVIGGIRYYPEDRLAHAIAPKGLRDEGATAAPASAGAATTCRMITGSSYTVRARPSGLHEDNIIGDRNYARRWQEVSGATEIDSIWTDHHTAAVGRRSVRADEPVHVEPKLSLAIDTRPSAIGDQTLPRRSQAVASRDVSVTSPREPSQAEGYNAQQPIQHTEFRSMPVAANPWGATGAILSAEPRASHLSGSQVGQSNARVGTHVSDGTLEDLLGTEAINRSSEIAPSSRSGASMFSQARGQKAPVLLSHPSISKDNAISSADSFKCTAGQASISMSPPFPPNVDNAGSTTVVRHFETHQQRMVRLMNSQGSEGMTPFTLPTPNIESRQIRDSMSSAGQSRGGSCSRAIIGKPTTNLATSKWAAEEVSTPFSTTNPSAKSGRVTSHLLSFKDSNIQSVQRDGNMKAKTARTNAGPGIDLLVANAAAAAMSAYYSATRPAATVVEASPSASQDMNTNARPTSRLPEVEAQSGAETHPTIQPHNFHHTTVRQIMTSAPRPRVIDQSRHLGQYSTQGIIQRGRGNFRSRHGNQDGSESDESEL